MAADAGDGVPSDALRRDFEGLRTTSVLFQLQARCFSYCQLVHFHHTGEDVSLFPAARRAAPHLTTLVDRLEADHRAVAVLLDDVEAAADALDDNAAGEGRQRLAAALLTLSTDLSDHLQREEETLGPVLATWDRWPFENASGA